VASTHGGVRVVFFDIRDTLGVVDRKGHLIKFKPSTDQLLTALKALQGLRLGVITNLPANVSSADGRAMLEEAGILSYLDPKGFVSNHEAGFEKPDPRIFAFAAEQMGVAPGDCLFCGENLIEVIAAQAAGMRALAKPFPPGRDFLLQPAKKGAVSDKSSGRLAETLLEEEHMVGKRIVMAAGGLAERLGAWQPGQRLPMRGLGLLVWLLKYFVDAFHHRKEEEVLIPFVLARGLDPAKCAFVADEHDQGRHYFAAMDIALRRLRSGDQSAVADFATNARGFVALYKEHGRKEDDLLLKAAGDLLSDADDSLMVDLMHRIGPVDPTLYYAVISELEAEVAA
jgi:HAD superfamily hydrolase (TIGR01509 family)